MNDRDWLNGKRGERVTHKLPIGHVMTGMLFLSREAMEDGAVRGLRKEENSHQPICFYLLLLNIEKCNLRLFNSNPTRMSHTQPKRFFLTLVANFVL